MMTQIENDWLSKHWGRLQQTNFQTPCQVLRAYAKDHDLAAADIDNQLNWNDWDYDSNNDLTTDIE
jgi:hypothetical protein